MKVLKPGREQQGWAREEICTGKGNGNGGCGAVLLVEEGDLFQTASHHYDGSSDYYTTFRCSACRVLTDISVPSGVKVRETEKKPCRPPAGGTVVKPPRTR